MAKKENTLENMLLELEETIKILESEDTNLEESFALYKKGMTVIKKSNDMIDKVEKQVLKLNELGELDEF
ncbi:MAG: exodeoxyribonuclease VII small subunit [Lachnospiraceae bacterium]